MAATHPGGGMSTLSTHVLDTASGRPASGVPLRLFAGDSLHFDGVTNQDGRCPELAALTLPPGRYRLEFEVAGYWRTAGVALTDPPFLEQVPIAFGIANDGHYHVPLLLSPYGYSTYRGS
ncbi:hydroxyisourate hydrolase [Xanthomonas nasturtii]|uniref:5-hydroxyisourate hydrolase n=1 Tax=Xanthomonas nasturtii TaxID=1843581 RepID=A0A3E1KQ52_9XANT|nr:hydroxyisourate hydrolase [Xanthomonas nasturtii]MCL1528957.1 hydroxyisourate hydrolase [Xanthomonas nasturtii]MCL1550524.1 hydroxyisourate hydrolase [Xanthomonas nasturtii]MCL1554686.1 hydroxyisourate hydrolase [Xanthomonas nasturtii]MCL1564093.1 hydroxyisourate hydrolase [Xanthomonas nasturtii]RFF41500.1 hydroxyisourate hydrolase [Xanthomonas nasturtii]